MNQQLAQTAVYMKQVGLPSSIAPVDTLSVEDLLAQEKFRQKLDLEFEQAFKQQDQSTVSVDKGLALSALSNQLYNVFVNAHTLGLAYLLPLGFRILHESLVTTLWTGEEIDRLQHNQYTVEQVYPALTTSSDQKLFRVTDYRGKVIKSPSYVPPYFDSVFEHLKGQELLDFEHSHRLLYRDDWPEGEDEQPTIPVCIIDEGDENPY